MAETKTKTETETKEAAEDITLPAYLDLPKAAGIAGAAQAQSFLDEVLMITSGDLSQHYQPGVSLRALEDAANDSENASGGILRDKLKRIRTLFSEAQNAKK